MGYKALPAKAGEVIAEKSAYHLSAMAMLGKAVPITASP
jgi:hypothetical protein